MKKDIHLIPVGNVSVDVCRWLVDALPRAFNCTCFVAAQAPHPKFAWNRHRKQYGADAVLARLPPAGAASMLAVADLDLYVPDLNFVFGLAQCDMARAIIALPRLRQSYYGLPENTVVFRKRVIKEAVHELGHLFGLRHCLDRRCVMAFSNSLIDTDEKGWEFCANCRKNLPPRIASRCNKFPSSKRCKTF